MFWNRTSNGQGKKQNNTYKTHTLPLPQILSKAVQATYYKTRNPSFTMCVCCDKIANKVKDTPDIAVRIIFAAGRLSLSEQAEELYS